MGNIIHSPRPVFKNILVRLFKANMKLQLSELVKSSDYLPKFQSFWYKILCFPGQCLVAELWWKDSNTKREFHGKKDCK